MKLTCHDLDERGGLGSMQIVLAPLDIAAMVGSCGRPTNHTHQLLRVTDACRPQNVLRPLRGGAVRGLSWLTTRNVPSLI